jgi:hypothetical protein
MAQRFFERRRNNFKAGPAEAVLKDLFAAGRRTGEDDSLSAQLVANGVCLEGCLHDGGLQAEKLLEQKRASRRLVASRLVAFFSATTQLLNEDRPRNSWQRAAAEGEHRHNSVQVARAMRFKAEISNANALIRTPAATALPIS